MRLLVTVAAAALAACSDAAAPAPDSGFDALNEAIYVSIREQGLAGAVAVVVHRDSGIVHLRGYGAFDEERIFLVASAGKPLSAGVLVRLAGQGLLDLDAPVERYLGASLGGGKSGITVAQLLSNSSGLAGLLDAPLYPPYRCQFGAGGSLAECARTIWHAEDTERRVPPDTRFRYGGAQWQLAGGVAEAVSGKSWSELVRETYAEPCGMTTLGYGNPFDGGVRGGYPDWFRGDPASLPPTANPNVEGGAYLSAEDYGRLLLMHLRGGTCGDARVLSGEAAERMRSDRIGPAYGGSTGHPALKGYGLGWWVDRTAPGTVASPGFYGTMPWMDAERGWGVAILLEANGAARDRMWAEVEPVLEAIIARPDTLARPAAAP